MLLSPIESPFLSNLKLVSATTGAPASKSTPWYNQKINGSAINWWILIVIVVGGLLLIAVVIVIIVKVKKAKKDSADIELDHW
jgi:hypothetical protein